MGKGRASVDKAARRRWMILSLFLIGTVGAIFYPADEQSTAWTPRVDRAGSLPPRPARVSSVAEQEQWQPLLADPFAPRKWEAPAPVQVAAPAPVATVVAPPALPVAPPLPFQFVGQMSDGTDQVVYLVRGEEALLARTGEVLEGAYKVLGLTALQIEFEHLPTGQKQTLVFPASNN